MHRIDGVFLLRRTQTQCEGGEEQKETCFLTNEPSGARFLITFATTRRFATSLKINLVWQNVAKFLQVVAVK